MAGVAPLEPCMWDLLLMENSFRVSGYMPLRLLIIHTIATAN